jgi:hypothetical protein
MNKDLSEFINKLILEKSMSDLQILIEAVIEQMKQDIAEGDVTAIEELLMRVPSPVLKGYLPEETT